MELQLHTFGRISEITGQSILAVQACSDVSDVREWLEATYPLIRKVPYQVAVNRKIVKENVQLHPNDELAVLPPFAGG
jgi:molybdopterin synthase sulfur carrier subunit